MNRQDIYRFVDGVTPLNADNLNLRVFDIDSRLGTLEQAQPSLNDAINNLVSLGLDRINSALLPAFNQILEIQQMGFLSAPIAAGSNAVFATGATAVTISASYKQYFQPPPWVVLVRAANATDYCIAQVTGWNSATGGLLLTITNQAGVSGTYTDVTVIGCPGGALAAIDAAAQVLSARTDVLAAQADVDAKAAAVAADYTAIQTIAAGAGVVSVNGVSGAVTGVEVTAHKGAANGYAGLDGSGHVPSSQLPVALASGVAGLDGSGKVPLSQLPASVQGCLQLQGSWNAATNTPALTSGIGTTGWVYKVVSGGSTTLDGIGAWNAGDYAVFDGAHWERIIGSAVTSTDILDSTATGRALLTASNQAAAQSSLGATGTGQALITAADQAAARAALGATAVGNALLTAASQAAAQSAIGIAGGYTLLATLTPSGVSEIAAAGLAAYGEYYIVLSPLDVSATATCTISLSADNGGSYPGWVVFQANNSITVVVKVSGCGTPVALINSSFGSGVQTAVSMSGQLNAIKISLSSGTFTSGTSILVYGR